jgi:hypothetical protein
LIFMNRLISQYAGTVPGGFCDYRRQTPGTGSFRTSRQQERVRAGWWRLLGADSGGDLQFRRAAVAVLTFAE